MIFSHPFQTVLFALDIIDFDLSRILLSSTVIPKYVPISIVLIMIVVVVTRCRLSKNTPEFSKMAEIPVSMSPESTDDPQISLHQI